MSGDVFQNDNHQVRVISLKDIKKECEKNETKLIVLGNDVYDVSSYIDQHPGGEDVLHENCGYDATLQFMSVNHSDEAIQKLKKFRIGRVPSSEALHLNLI